MNIFGVPSPSIIITTFNGSTFQVLNELLPKQNKTKQNKTKRFK